MHAFFSRKQSLLILCAGLCAAVITALLLNYALSEPRLGFLYDFLLKCRQSPPVSENILLVDTDEIVEPDDVFTVLVTLTEMNASALVIEVPVLGSAPGRAESDEEIRRRINDEYTLLGSNIRNLFDAIRLGSVSPMESGAYVDNLVELAERGRDRLNTALTRQSGAGTDQAERAKAVFGSVLQAVDLRSQSEEAVFWYSRPKPDRDGTIRRIAPLLIPAPEKTNPDTSAPGAIEHIVYRSLRPRWNESALEYAERGPVLVNRSVQARLPGGDTPDTIPPGDSAVPAAADAGQAETAVTIETRFALDKNGNLLFEQPRKNEGFRHLSLERFREYEKADRLMRRLLRDAEALGAYSETRPERIPLFLCDYAASLREDLLKTPLPPSAASAETPSSEAMPLSALTAEKRAAWITARAEYISSLDEFLYGPAEMTLVNGYEEIIATETLDDSGIAKLQNLRDELIRAFVSMREQHRELAELHSLLTETLDSSFCIMGPAKTSGGTSVSETSALLANTLLTGHSITPGQSRYIVFWSLAAVFIILICIHSLRPLVVLLSGLAAGLLCVAGFGWSFIISAYWIDPRISAAACLAGTLVIFTARSLVMYCGARRFQLAYGAAVSKPCLQRLIRTGRPPVGEILTVRAAIIAVKNPGLLSREDREEPHLAARAAAEFHSAVSAVFKRAGAVILGCEGDTVLACFGSPLERVYLEQAQDEARYGDETNAYSSHHPAIKAAGCITELLQQSLPLPAKSGASPAAQWRFGIDCGDCAFSWSEETGYTANGRPMVRARVLASLASRYRIRILVTGTVREKLNQPVRKINTLGSNGAVNESFYELPV
ncbi:MAG: hypothetical protein LBD48_07120 [Treponema sp.]|jgi:class 3 adenylate cyclase|nr:hypothetical protein [Treponema sp.]